MNKLLLIALATIATTPSAHAADIDGFGDLKFGETYGQVQTTRYAQANGEQLVQIDGLTFSVQPKYAFDVDTTGHSDDGDFMATHQKLDEIALEVMTMRGNPQQAFPGSEPCAYNQVRAALEQKYGSPARTYDRRTPPWKSVGTGVPMTEQQRNLAQPHIERWVPGTPPPPPPLPPHDTEWGAAPRTLTLTLEVLGNDIRGKCVIFLGYKDTSIAFVPPTQAIPKSGF